MDAKVKEAIVKIRSIGLNEKEEAALSTLTAMAEENAALKAEVERLTELAATMNLEEYLSKERLKVVSARAEKAEAELQAALDRYSRAEDELSCANSKNTELKAELDAARPLLEAVMTDRSDNNFFILKEAYAYRERKEREGKP